jgi:plastocyanin
MTSHKMGKGTLQMIGALLVAVFVFGCGSSNDNGSTGSCTVGNAVATSSVTVKDFSFDPSCIKILAGETVTWTNTGMASHTVTSDSGAPVSFDSHALGDSGTFSFTFNSAETVKYHCTPHESLGMKGTVIVQ